MVQRTRNLIGGAVLIAVVATAVAACGSKSSSTSTAMTPAQSRAAIEQSWKTFFDGKTAIDKRVALLAGADKFSSEIKSLASNPLAKQTSATVSKVVLNGSDKATVTFTLLFAGNPVVKDVEGQAVLVDGTWKVDAASMCRLLALQGAVPAGCKSAASSP
jgi:hypothetical protein